MCGNHVDELLVFRYFVDISRDGSAKLIHQLSVHEVYLTDDVIIATLQAMLFATLSLCSTKKNVSHVIFTYSPALVNQQCVFEV